MVRLSIMLPEMGARFIMLNSSLDSRKYKIFDILIRAILVLCLIAFSISGFVNTLSIVNHRVLTSAPMKPIVIITSGLLLLLYFGQKGYSKLSAQLFIIVLLLAGMYNSWVWGADVPIGYLLYTLVIVLAGIIVGSKFAFNILIITALFLISLSHLQATDIVKYDEYWLSSPPSIVDGIISSISLSIIALVSWVSNREIEKSLTRAQISEKELKEERDLLEIRVEERTKQLKKAQMEKMLSMYRFADLGRLSAGLIHDIVNPLTVVSLNLEQVYDHSAQSTQENIHALQLATKRALTGTKRIEEYVDAARKHIQKQDDQSLFPICTEIGRVKSLFSYRCRKEQVSFITACDPSIHLRGNSVRFNQCLSNIVANALDAQTLSTKKNKTVHVTVEKDKDTITVKISDNALGIKPSVLKHIFDPFFTTKGIDKGTGIGLSMTKEIIQDSFKGTITVETKSQIGTTFTISLPC